MAKKQVVEFTISPAKNGWVIKKADGWIIAKDDEAVIALAREYFSQHGPKKKDAAPAK